MFGFTKKTVLALAIVVSGGCATSLEKTGKIATDYNQAFAASRNEALLLNVLRAAADEPLQFSTMGTVTGSLRTTTAAEAALEGVFVAAADNFKPKITLGGGPNPSVTIIPLSSKEFTQGILRPVDPETVDFMLSQHWDRELVLPLIVGGVTCKDDQVRINHGSNLLTNWKFALQAAVAGDFSLTAPDGSEVVLPLAPGQVAELLEKGVGEGRSIKRIMTHAQWLKFLADSGETAPAATDGAQDLVYALIEKKQSKTIVGLPLDAHCGDDSNPVLHDEALLRSVDSIIHFLAEIHRLNIRDEIRKCETGGTLSPVPATPDAELRLQAAKAVADRARKRVQLVADEVRAAEMAFMLAGTEKARGALEKAKKKDAMSKRELAAAEALHGVFADPAKVETLTADQRGMLRNLVSPRDLFRVRLSCGEVEPRGTFVWTRFHGRTYYIPQKGFMDPRDRTLEVLALLSDLIALQTSESVIKANAPLITVAQ